MVSASVRVVVNTSWISPVSASATWAGQVSNIKVAA